MGAETRLTFLNLGNPTGLKFTVEHGGGRGLFDFGLDHTPGQAPFSLGLAFYKELKKKEGRSLRDRPS